ncbi:MAG TPA: hypothetical protein VLL51_08330 [Gemmatimonadales bacterium]|nr:hypothetical protein [Gemmatimonadales bacterium]
MYHPDFLWQLAGMRITEELRRVPQGSGRHRKIARPRPATGGLRVRLRHAN